MCEYFDGQIWISPELMVSMPSVIYIALSIKTCTLISMQYIIYCTVARQETPRYNKKLLAELPLCRVYDASLLCWERDQYPGNQRYTTNRLHQRYTVTPTLEYTTSFNTKPFGHTSFSGCYDFIISVCLRHIQPIISTCWYDTSGEWNLAPVVRGTDVPPTPEISSISSYK